MARVVTDYLDITAKRYPNKKAFVDEKREITFLKYRKRHAI